MPTEAESQATLVAEESGDSSSPLVDARGKLGLAAIGAVSLALEAAEKLLRRMVERGEMDERNARRILNELRAKRPHLPRPPRPVIAIDTRKLASKADVEGLEQQVAALTAQVEQLHKGASEGA
jgi:polyhydroxyalkanoate synthesis regulator phasin